MSFLKYLKEELYKSDHLKTTYFDGYVEIYKNPKEFEVDEIMNNSNESGVRFGIDENDDIYAWLDEVLHEEMSRYLHKDWVVMLQYTQNHPTLWLSSGSTYKDWVIHGDHHINYFRRILPKITSIEMQTKPYTVAWSKKEQPVMA